MKKKVIAAVIAIAVLAVLFVPIPGPIAKDGGTREYRALTYKIVKWNKIIGEGETYSKTSFYFIPDNFKSLDELWETESESVPESFRAIVTDIDKESVTVAPLYTEDEFRSSDSIVFGIARLPYADARVGDVVEVKYTGGIEETYPARINALAWSPAVSHKDTEYTGDWNVGEDAEEEGVTVLEDVTITDIYKDCFFAETIYPPYTTVKINGTLSEEWCLGDTVVCTLDDCISSVESGMAEGTLLGITEAEDPNIIDGPVCYKPVIYLYPEEETNVTVTLDGVGLFCTYPKYHDGWTVTAYPDGHLKDSDGRTYNYLYWEGRTEFENDFSSGFCIRGEDTASFLEDALEKLGLNRKEANEFIVYWLPLMEGNIYNIISFDISSYEKAAPLRVSPEPDTLIRVFMSWKPAESEISIEEETLTCPERNGFTVVEWGGSEIK